MKASWLRDFKYSDKRRILFVTEESDTMIGGYEIFNEDKEKSSDVMNNELSFTYFEAFNLALKNKDDKMINVLKSGLTNLQRAVPFKKYKKDKVQQ